jgi:hypothetical protein
MNADHAAQMLVTMMADTEVPFGVRAKIAQDLLDRAGLGAAQLHKIVPMDVDPVVAFFEGILEQGGLTAPAALDRAPDDDQPRELESGNLEVYGQDLLDYEEAHEDAEVITVPETEPEPERQHSDTPPRLFPPEVVPNRRRPR